MVFAEKCKIEHFIQDAERHRRTPRLSAISGKMVDACDAVCFWLWPIQCATLAEIGDAAFTILPNSLTEKVKQFDYKICCKMSDSIIQISCQNLQNFTTIAPKSM